MRRFLSPRYLVVCLSRLVSHSLFFLKGRRLIVTPEQLIWPAGKGAVLVVNHKSMLDILVTQAAVGKRYCCWMMKDSLMRAPVAGPFFRWHGGFPINRHDPRSALKALKTAVDLAKNHNQLVVIFPEATRYRDDVIGTFPSRMAVEVAFQAGVPIIPIGIRNILGTSGAGPVTVTVGEPIHLPAEATKQDRTRINHEVRAQLAVLSGYPLLSEESS